MGKALDAGLFLQAEHLAHAGEHTWFLRVVSVERREHIETVGHGSNHTDTEATSGGWRGLLSVAPDENGQQSAVPPQFVEIDHSPAGLCLDHGQGQVGRWRVGTAGGLGGSPVTFTATIETPPGAGSVVAADWDLDGTGEYPTAGSLSNHNSAKVTVTASHAYDRPGVYFAAIRATSQRQGDAETPYARVQNLGRVRVVVK